MRKKANIVNVIVIGLVVCVLGCAGVIPDPIVHTPIAQDYVIGVEKKEIVLDTPFKIKRTINELCFFYTDSLIEANLSKPPKFPDGENLEITAVAVDQNQVAYAFDKISRGGGDMYCMRPFGKDVKKYLYLHRKNISFVSLILSSNRRVKLKRIEWLSYNKI